MKSENLSRQCFLLCGLPGSGKGTQLSRLARYDIKCLSCGDFFRWHVRNKTAFGLLALSNIQSGTLTSDDETSKMMLSEIAKDSSNTPLLIEGYPRTATQLEDLKRFIDERGWSLSAAFYLTVPEETLVDRASNRLICPVCGKIYNKQSAPPKILGRCDYDDAVLSVRLDDAASVVRKRIAFYADAETPMVVQLREHGLLHYIDANRLDADIAEELIRQMSAYMTSVSSITLNINKGTTQML